MSDWKKLLNNHRKSMPTVPMMQVDSIADEAIDSLSREINRRMDDLFVGPNMQEPPQIFGKPMPLNNLMASKGRFGDTEMAMVDNKPAHVNPAEKMAIDNFGKVGEEIVKNVGAGTTNPNTGLKEYHQWHNYPLSSSDEGWHIHEGNPMNQGEGIIYGDSAQDVMDQISATDPLWNYPLIDEEYGYDIPSSPDEMIAQEYEYVDSIGNLVQDYGVDQGYMILRYLMSTRDNEVGQGEPDSLMRYLTETMGMTETNAREFADSFDANRAEQFQFIEDSFNLDKQALVDTRSSTLSDIQTAYTGKMSETMAQKEQAMKKSGMATGGLSGKYGKSITGLKDASIDAQEAAKTKFGRDLGDLQFQRSEDIIGERSDILADFYSRIATDYS